MTRSDESLTIWVAIGPEGTRYFLIPDRHVLPAGDFSIRSTEHGERSVDLRSVEAFELTEDQARRWAKDQLRQTLGELKEGFDEKIAELRQRLDDFNRRPVTDSTTITPNAGGALLELLKQLPGVVAHSLSSDEQKVESARETMKDLQQRLKDAGIDLDDRFTGFPDRLADLRKSPDRKS